ncbi:unnamed protein product [Boreogadus saida]
MGMGLGCLIPVPMGIRATESCVAGGLHPARKVLSSVSGRRDPLFFCSPPEAFEGGELFTAAEQTEPSLTAGCVLTQSHSCSLSMTQHPVPTLGSQRVTRDLDRDVSGPGPREKSS